MIYSRSHNVGASTGAYPITVRHTDVVTQVSGEHERGIERPREQEDERKGKGLYGF